MSFDIGDVVTLKSGGPEMTVVATTDKGAIRCEWYESSPGEFKAHTFPPTALKVYEPPKMSF